MFASIISLNSAILLTAGLTIWRCHCLPLQDMNKNVSSLKDNETANGSQPALLASPQDFAPLRVPDEHHLTGHHDADNFSVPNDLKEHLPAPPPPQPVLLLPEGLHGSNNIQPVHPNATHLEELMDKLHIPIPDPNSPIIQPKVPLPAPVVPLIRSRRDLLPSIVGSGNKQLSGNPAGAPGLSPAGVAQAKGELPRDVMANPFGANPPFIRVGNGMR